MATREEKLQCMLEPTVVALGFELWGLEYLSQGRYSVIRLYIDSADGVSVDDCAVVSRQVGAVLDVEDPINGDYTLEVSSPGMDRLLFSLPQYGAYVGEVIEVRLRTAFEGRRKFKGVLKAIAGDEVVLQVEEHEYLLPYETIEKARVQPRV